MPRCIVRNCTSRYDRQKDSTGQEKAVRFFCLPKDEYVRKRWLSKCGRPDLVKNGRVCSIHFTADCFEQNMRNTLLGINNRGTIKLKTGSIPTLNLLLKDNSRSTGKRKQEDEMYTDLEYLDEVLELESESCTATGFTEDDSDINELSSDDEFFKTDGPSKKNNSTDKFESYNENCENCVKMKACIKELEKEVAELKRVLNLTKDELIIERESRKTSFSLYK